MNRKNIFLLMVFISCSIHAIAQTDYYYYDDYGTKIPLSLNENKALVCIPKGCDMISERIRANVQPFFSRTDEFFDIFFITRADLEKLTSLDFWEEDSKSVIITPGYFRDDVRGEFYQEIFFTPYLGVKLKKEEDIDLLTPYLEKYSLQITKHRPSMPLSYFLAVTLDSEKGPLECANEMFESGNFAASVPDYALAGYGSVEEPNTIRNKTTPITEESSEIYDLNGRKLTSKPASGIYILQGQKKLAGSR